MLTKKIQLGNQLVELPYTISVDTPKYKIGIFGDSFAELAVHAKYAADDGCTFNHETSWQYFLANLLNSETHSYGISHASLGDIAYTVLNSTLNYDYYIIFHTNPKRSAKFSNLKYDGKLYKKVNKFLQNKKVLNIYWHPEHKIKSFGDEEYVCYFHLSNQNHGEINGFERAPNPLDLTPGICHMSARGNLLLAIDLHKIIAKQL